MKKATLPEFRIFSRTSKPGPEADLVKAVLGTRLPMDSRLSKMIYLEPELPTGYPDIVVAYHSKRISSYLPARARLNNRHIQLLHYIFSSGGVNLSMLEKSLLYPRKHIHELVNDLLEAGLINLNGSYVRHQSLRRIFGLRSLIAIEAKISKWQKALEQAAANTWFASESYILLPHRKDFTDVVNSARKIGIGVLCFDGDKVDRIYSARPVQLPVSYGSWIFNELVLYELNLGYQNDRPSRYSKKLS